MALEQYRAAMLPAIEEALKAVVQRASSKGQEALHAMLTYHLGWEGEGAGPRATGKRIRPTLLLLCTAAAQDEWHKALPAAAAVELLHNFSLIHDDIQDKSEQRRGRPTLWHLHGVPQAINAGDAMFALAHMALEDLETASSSLVYLEAARLLPRTSLQLTQGQHLDLAYESMEKLSTDAYWPMVWGKTAMLIRACTHLGALVAGAGGVQLKAYMVFGEKLGLAYQVHDDLLGIWGDPDEMGKSAHSDLLSGKKSLPVLFALNQNGEFARRWKNGGVNSVEVRELADLLEAEGGRDYAREQSNRLTTEALEALAAAKPETDAGGALAELAEELGTREV
ncbi:MAG: polyprenyl synthetase family protein [Anaerolineales bacterium]